MSTNISKYFSHQSAPALLLNFPRLLYLYFGINHVSVLRMRYARRAITHELHSRPTLNSVVDAGCGMGDLLFTIPILRRAPHVLGIDVSPSNIDLCQKLSESVKARNMTFLCGDLATVNIPKGQEMIICVAVLMYIREDETMLKKFHDALAPDGTLLLYTAVNYRRNLSLYKHLSAIKGFDYDDIIGRPHSYTDETLERLLINCGFKIERKEHSFGSSAAVMFEISAIFEWIVKSHNPLILLLILPFYFVFYPLYLLSMTIDYYAVRATGNGVMITAVKQ